MSNYSNILHFPHYFKQAMILNERIIEDDVLRKLILGSDLTLQEITSTPHILSGVSGDYCSLNLTNLVDMFPIIGGGLPSATRANNFEKNYFKVKVSVLGVLP